MKGQVLGFDGQAGAISGEDGQRYRFTLADWKGERPPQGRDAVDFLPAGTDATEVYCVQSSLGAALGGIGASARSRLGDSASSPDTVKARAFVAERPQVIVAGVALLASLFLGFATGTSSVTAVGFPGMLSTAASQLSQVSGLMGGLLGRAGERAAPSTGGLQLASLIAYLLYLIPVLAAFAIYRDAVGKRMAVLEIALGVLCIGSIAIYTIGKSSLVGLFANMPFGGAAAGSIGFGFGGYVLVLCGILLLLTATGRVRRTPGL